MSVHLACWKVAFTFFLRQKVNTRVVRSRQMPCESQRSLVHSISCPLVRTIHSGTNSFCNELEVSSKHLAKNYSHIKTRLIFDDFKIWCGPQICVQLIVLFFHFQPLPPLNPSISVAMPRLAVKLIFLSGDSEDEIFEFKPDAKAVGFMVLGPWRFGQKEKTHPLNCWFSHIFGMVTDV